MGLLFVPLEERSHFHFFWAQVASGGEARGETCAKQRSSVDTWTGCWRLKKEQPQVVWLREKGVCVWGWWERVVTEAAEAEAIGCWCPGVPCQGIRESP